KIRNDPPIRNRFERGVLRIWKLYRIQREKCATSIVTLQNEPQRFGAPCTRPRKSRVESRRVYHLTPQKSSRESRQRTSGFASVEQAPRGSKDATLPGVVRVRTDQCANRVCSVLCRVEIVAKKIEECLVQLRSAVEARRITDQAGVIGWNRLDRSTRNL